MVRRQGGQHSAKYFMKNSAWLVAQSYIFVRKQILCSLIIFINSLSSIKIECVQPPTMPSPIAIQHFFILMCIWILRFGQALCHSLFFFPFLRLLLYGFCFGSEQKSSFQRNAEPFLSDKECQFFLALALAAVSYCCLVSFSDRRIEQGHFSVRDPSSAHKSVGNSKIIICSRQSYSTKRLSNSLL